MKTICKHCHKEVSRDRRQHLLNEHPEIAQKYRKGDFASGHPIKLKAVWDNFSYKKKRKPKTALFWDNKTRIFVPLKLSRAKR